MKDKQKIRLALFLALCSIIFPGLALIVGWLGWDFKFGAIGSVVVFAGFFLISGFVLVMVNDVSVLVAMIPFALACIYSIMPDLLPLPIDDTLVVATGAILSFALFLKRDPTIDKKIILSLLFSAVYTLVGGIIPGPVDELLVYSISAGSVVMGAKRALPSGEQLFDGASE